MTFEHILQVCCREPVEVGVWLVHLHRVHPVLVVADVLGLQVDRLGAAVADADRESQQGLQVKVYLYFSLFLKKKNILVPVPSEAGPSFIFI